MTHRGTRLLCSERGTQTYNAGQTPTNSQEMSEPDERPIACDLSALTLDEQARRESLLERIVGSAATVAETADGYSLVIDAPPSLSRDLVEWFLLEKRCCPFLHLGLELVPGDDRPRITLSGKQGVKGFLASTGLAKLAEASRPS